MALTESTHFPLNTSAPDFTLLDTVSGELRALQSLKGDKGTVIFFICNHCPFVLHINEQLVALANDYLPLGIGFIAISSNSAESHPQDGPEFMKQRAEELHYPFPYLYDATQEVARAYAAVCTPDIYVFDEELHSVYHGQLDGSRPGNSVPVTGEDLRKALDALLNRENPIENQQPSIGCNIKWHAFK